MSCYCLMNCAPQVVEIIFNRFVMYFVLDVTLLVAIKTDNIDAKLNITLRLQDRL